MNQELALWALGILCALVGTLMLIVLTRVLKQGDDTNDKVTKQGETLTRVDTSVQSLSVRVSSLDEWRSQLLQREINEQAAEILELRRERGDGERRHGAPDRREA